MRSSENRWLAPPTRAEVSFRGAMIFMGVAIAMDLFQVAFGNLHL